MRNIVSQLVYLMIAVGSVLTPTAHTFAQDAPKVPVNLADELAPDEVDEAIDKAMEYLVKRQSNDGQIADNRRNATAMSSLAIMAFAAAGHMPNDPTDEGRASAKALAYVLGEQRIDKDGYFGRDGSRMYGHGIVTLMLTEVLGHGANAEQDRLIRERCEQAVDMIVRSQKKRKSPAHQGGWRYSPDSGDSDLSVTVWQVMALRSAHNAGLDVPVESVNAAVKYLERCYASARDDEGTPIDKKSAFVYMVQGDGKWRGVRNGGRLASPSTAAAGLLAMQVCGRYDAPEVIGAADWLLEKTPRWGETWFYYATYYYAQGMYQRGGEHAETARKVVREVLLDRQKDTGAWQVYGSEQSAGEVYSTSMAVLSLAVKHHYLPIYQR